MLLTDLVLRLVQSFQEVQVDQLVQELQLAQEDPLQTNQLQESQCVSNLHK